MSRATVTEQEILEALRRIPAQRWGDVARYLGTLQADQGDKSGNYMIRTAADLAKSELVGIWADRTDLGDSQAFARRLRQEAEQRRGANNATGH
jgi:hypothetical protein